MKQKFLTAQKERVIFSSNKFERIVGIDEAGRGCLAGPVCIGAFVLDPNHSDLDFINDSKKLSFKLRSKLFNELSKYSHKVILVDNSEIDNLGIARVIENAISKIVAEFHDGKTLFLIDGVFKKDFGNFSKKIIKGDSIYYSIAAASILAKHTRDLFMINLSKSYPNFLFSEHKGYGTKKHIHEIQKFGYTDIHRKSFKLKIPV